ncbi:MAG: AAA family ATPase [Armatimonadota bacterium]
MSNESVIRVLREAIAANPDDLALRLHLAKLLEESEQYTDALEEYRQVMAREPLHHTAWLGVIRMLFATGQEAQAQRQLDAFQRVYPDDMEAELLRESHRPSEPVPEPEEEEVAEPIPHFPCNIDWTPASVGRMFRVERTNVSFADVGGMDALKEQIRLMIIYPLQRPDLYKAYGKRVGGRILLYGPPGCGKTLIARAIATECEMPMLYLGINDILSPWVGVSERLLHEAFEAARDHAPCVVFIDELDALGVKRTEAMHHSRVLVSQLLEELDGFASRNERLLILGATNSPWHLDPALLRPKRFDRVLFVPPPDLNARVEILKIHTRNRPLEPRFDYVKVASTLRYFTGADIEALCERVAEEAIQKALRTGKQEPLTTEMFLRLAKSITPITLEWARTARNYATYANETGLYDPVAGWLEQERLR